MTKRFIALFMALILVFSLIPSYAFSDDTGDVEPVPAATPAPTPTPSPTPTAAATEPVLTATPPALTGTAPTESGSASAESGLTSTPSATPVEPTPTPSAAPVKPTPTPSAAPVEPTPTPSAAPVEPTPTPSGSDELPEKPESSEPSDGLLTSTGPAKAASGVQTAAVQDEEGYPKNMSERVYVAIYNGSGFPGEPAWYSTSSYTSINSSFGKSYGFSAFASSAEGIINSAILNAMVPGKGSGSTKVWGVFSTTGMDLYLNQSVFSDANEATLIKAVKGSSADPNDYRIIWYVIKYQTDTDWHIDGIIVAKEKFNVNYYGNGNTAGSVPTGATGLNQGSVYTVQSPSRDFANKRNNYSYTFAGWNTKADGTGTFYAPNAQITINSDVSLYAQWNTPTRSISVEKKWEDNENQDGSRPDSVQVHLLKDGAHMGPSYLLTLSAATGWTGTWNDLPALDQYGYENDYFIEEVEIPGYVHNITEPTDGHFVLTNYHTPEKTTVAVQKIWDDDNDRDAMRPQSVTVQLEADGQVIADSQRQLSMTNAWATSWTGLDKYVAGREIVYTVDEITASDGYTVSYGRDDVTGRILITNSHESEKTSLTVTKVWDDDGNRDDLRPESLELSVYANGVATGRVVTLTAPATASDTWSTTVTDLVKYSGGAEIVYTFEETAVPQHYSTVAGFQRAGAENGYTIKNAHQPLTRSLSITKDWQDNFNQDGKRPASVTIDILDTGDDNALVRQVTLDAANNWSTVVNDLPMYREGEIGVPVTYGVHEDKLTDYNEPVISGSADTGFVVTNSRSTETRSVIVEKVWQDNDNRYLNRPDSVEVVLLENGQPVSGLPTLILGPSADADANWKGRWDGLPAYRNGVLLQYSVKERGVPVGYSPVPSYSTLTDDAGNISYLVTLTNVYSPKTVGLHVEKVWDDNYDQDGNRPSGVKVHLEYKLHNQDWADTGSVKTLSSDNIWTADFIELPIYYDDNPILYRVVEEPIPGYAAPVYSAEYFSADSSENHIITVTNTLIPEKTQLTVSKTWEDENNRDGIRPAAVTLTLYADGKPTDKTITLPNAQGQWSGSFTDLVKNTRGRPINYTVVETPVEGYSVEYLAAGDAPEVIEVVNTHVVTQRNISLSKVWDDDNNRDEIRPKSVSVQVLANGVPYGEPVSLSTQNNFGRVLTLPANENGQPIYYTVQELDVPNGYTHDPAADVVPVTDDTGLVTGYTLTNHHVPRKINVTVTKVWDDDSNNDGARPDSINVHLLADGTHMGPNDIATLSGSGDVWTHTWYDLFYNAEGDPIIYVAEEMPVEGYMSVNSYSTDENGNINITITNSRANEKRAFSVQKVWDDTNNQDGLRPESIEVILTADGVATGKSAVLTAENHWRTTWTDLEVYNDGQEITYSADELSVPAGYTKGAVTTDGHLGNAVITNSHSPAVTSVTVTKQWNDENNNDNKRPEKILVTLYRNGLVHATQELTAANALNASNWAYTWYDLPLYHGIREENFYTVEETAYYYSDGVERSGVPEGYESSGIGTADNNYTIVNTLQFETVSITAHKQWDDENNQDGKRVPVELRVYKDGVATKRTVYLSPENNWTGTVDGLRRYELGREIVYTVVEENVPAAYECSGIGTADNNYTITNSYEPIKIELRAEKIWDDNNDQDGKRPAAVEITLLDNGLPIGEKKIVHQGNGWSVSWPDMDRYRNGQFVDYSVIETASWPAGTTEFTEANRVEGPASVYTVHRTYTPRSDNVRVSTATLTNSYTPEKTSLIVQKVWDDGDNQDGKRPDEVSFTLWYNLSDDPSGWTATDLKTTMNADSHWSAVFTNLQKYHNRKLIKYNAVEDALPEELGYTVSYDDSKLESSRIVTVTNSRTPETVSVSMAKVWDDNDNQDNVRPDTVTVHLMVEGMHANDFFKDGREYKKVLSAADAAADDDSRWLCTWDDLPRNMAGSELYYSVYEEVDETTAQLYSAGDPIVSRSNTENGTVVNVSITNTHEVELISVPVRKTWDDNDNQDGIRPESVIVSLLADGELIADVQPLLLSAHNDWGASFVDVPKYNKGAEIAYSVQESYPDTVSEAVLSAYSSKIVVHSGSFEIINHLTPETIDATAIKIWDDNGDSDGKRPDTITLHLTANGVHANEFFGTDQEFKRVLSAADAVDGDENKWSCVWEDLPRNYKGQPIYYRIYEEPVFFKNSASSTADEPMVLASNQYDTSYSYDNDSFTVTITNRYVPELVDVSVHKVWIDGDDRDGRRPDSVQVQLIRKDSGDILDSVTLDQDNVWYHTWEVPRYKNHGQPIEYEVVEVAPRSYDKFYTHSDTRDEENGSFFYVLTSTHDPAVTDIVVEKLWNDEDNNDGMRPEGIIVQLYADTAPDKDGNVTKIPMANGRVILSESNNWSVRWMSNTSYPLYLYNYKDADGNVRLRDYDIKEIGYVKDGLEIELEDGENYAGYIPSVEDIDGYNFRITNSKATEKISLTVKKVWDDNNNNDGMRPATVSLSLLENGSAHGEKIVLGENGVWEHTFTGLYKYSGGILNDYTVAEDVPDGYTVSTEVETDAAGNITVTLRNTHKPATRLYTITKVWRDANNFEKLRPDSVSVLLYKNGIAYGDMIQLSAANNWQYQIELPLFENGVPLVWNVAETSIPRYYYVTYDQATLTVINTIQSRTVPRTGDYNDFLPWMLMFAFCAGGAAIVNAGDKKKHGKK